MQFQGDGYVFVRFSRGRDLETASLKSVSISALLEITSHIIRNYHKLCLLKYNGVRCGLRDVPTFIGNIMLPFGNMTVVSTCH